MKKIVLICLLYVLGCVLFVVISCIKDKGNLSDIFYDLCDFFRDWWYHIRIGAAFLIGLLILSYIINP